ncbi:dihydroxyacetone kinase, L subunit [Propionibacterium sp. oral taxon 192 str. F0372]|nr:dihydroxyacetone kinase, L subunit [Propionibacterium sp. oral taxon 192 str. F0372]
MVHEWLACFAERVETGRGLLNELDRFIGDGDHGTNMVRGMSAVVALVPEPDQGISGYLRQVAMTLIRDVGGAAGPLYGTFFLRACGVLAILPEPSHAVWCAALQAGVEGVAERGRCMLGDKTLFDVLAPAVDAFAADFVDPWGAAARRADSSRLQTADMIASKGRAAFLGTRSLGVVDPGATSASWLMAAGAEVMPSS